MWGLALGRLPFGFGVMVISGHFDAYVSEGLMFGVLFAYVATISYAAIRVNTFRCPQPGLADPTV